MKSSSNPLYQIIYFASIILLILSRVLFDKITFYVNLANYISMTISIISVFFSVISKAKKSRKKNICKSILLILSIILVLIGILILIGEIILTSLANDIFTLVALLFCICNIVIENIIIKIFSLTIK